MSEMVATSHDPWYAAVEDNPATTMTASRRNDDGAVTRATGRPACEGPIFACVRPPYRF
jgi:hypothetical protein